MSAVLRWLFPKRCKAPAWEPGDDPAVDKPYRCTRYRVHRGEHVAHGVGHRPICSWPRWSTLVTDYAETSS